MRWPVAGTSRSVLAVTASAVLLLAGCSAEGPSGQGPEAASVAEAHVDVDTPKLRKLREAAGLEACSSSDRPAVDGGLPEVTLPCLGGGEDVTLSSLRGPLVVNLWASWCGPCREELPFYQRLHEQDGVEVLGIDYQDVLPAEALVLAEETGVTYPSLADPGGEVRAPFRVRGLPKLVLVDAEGKVVYEDFVAIESYDQLADLVQKHLGVAVGTDG